MQPDAAGAAGPGPGGDAAGLRAGRRGRRRPRAGPGRGLRPLVRRRRRRRGVRRAQRDGRWRPSAPTGAPAARTVLLKGYDGRGLRFFTNPGSAKAAELAANPRAALVFPWHAVSPAGAGDRRPSVELDRDEVDGLLRDPAARLAAGRVGQPAVVGGAARGPSWTPRWPRSAARFPARAGAGAAGLGRLPGGAGRPGSSGPAGPGGCTTGCATGVPDGSDDRAPGPVSASPRGPGQQRPAGLGAEGTCPAQARGSGDCLGFAGHDDRAGDPTASGAARGASWQPPHASDKYSSVRTTSLPCTSTLRPAAADHNDFRRVSVSGSAIQSASARPEHPAVGCRRRSRR